MSDMSASSISSSPSNSWYPCSDFAQSAAIVVATAIALAALSGLTIGIFAHCEIIVGLNSISQWTLIGGVLR